MDVHHPLQSVVCLGFVVVERTLEAKGREKFRTVSRRYHSREAANQFLTLIKAQNPRDEYYVREEMGLDGLPPKF